MWKIVKASNYDKEMYWEEFVNLPPMTETDAHAVCQAINKGIDPMGEDYYKVVHADYKLYKFEP